MPPPQLPQANRAYSSPYGPSQPPQAQPQSQSQPQTQSQSQPQPQHRSTPSKSYDSPARPYASPYASPSATSSPAPSSPASPFPVQRQPQVMEQFLPTRMNLINVTTLPANRRSSNGIMDPPLAPPASSKGPKRTLQETTTPAAKKFKNENYYNNTDRLLENEVSPLYKDETNLKMILQHPLAQNSLATSLHGHQLPDTNSDDFAGAAADFKEDGRGGRYDHDWAAQAQSASNARRVGAFDEYDEDHFKKYWATDSRELSDNDGEKKGNSGGCGDIEKKYRQHDEYDDDSGTGGFGGGGKTSGINPTHSATGNGYGKKYANGSASSYDNGGYGSNTQYANASVPDFTRNTNYSDKVNYSKHGSTPHSKSNYGYTTTSEFRQLPTPPVTPLESKSAPIHSSINDSADMNNFSKLSMVRGWLPEWEGRGYCDNPTSIYPPLD